jgi:hypothetical protein
MIGPVMPSRMKEFRNRARFWIDASQVRSFMQITIDAGQCQVIEVVASAMNSWDDVFDVKHRERRIVLVEVAILTSVAGAFAYPSFGTRQHL